MKMHFVEEGVGKKKKRQQECCGRNLLHVEAIYYFIGEQLSSCDQSPVKRL